MYFQIELLVLWPDNNEFMPRVVPFELGKLNVITGASKTGKSAIIPIIDYCLGSSDCFIPVDVIRDCVAWYGVVIKAQSKSILFARKAPRGDKVSNEFYFSDVDNVFPLKDIEANANTDDIKTFLNHLTSISNLPISDELDDKNFGARLSFRDMMAFSFQNQDIVANQSIMFYKTHSHVHRERLKIWLPFILGAESIEMLEARQHIKELDLLINKYQKELASLEDIARKGANSLLASLFKAREYGFIEEKFDTETPIDSLLQAAKSILDLDLSEVRVNIDAIEEIGEELQKLEQASQNIGAEIFTLKKRLEELQRLRRTVSLYRNDLKAKSDRVGISKWLMEVSANSEACPLCGSKEHTVAQSIMDESFSKFKEYENALKHTRKLPPAFAREEGSLRKELQNLFDKQDSINIYINEISSKHYDAKKVYEYDQQKNQFIGSLRTTVDYAKRAYDNNGLVEQLEELNSEKQKLHEFVDEASLQRRMDDILYDIGKLMYNKLQTLDVEDKYRRVYPRFVIKDLSIKVQSDSGSWHYLTEVGSASNWVAFHIALMCALQEYAINQRSDSPIPGFVIFDQPSQVYFPKVRRKTSDVTDDIKYDDEDIAAVRQIFSTIATSINGVGGQWQAIVVDHAGSEIYGGIEGLNEVAVWRDGVKLVPLKWVK